MKGQWCDRNQAVFCQESTGCDNCTVPSGITFQAKIETHNLREIQTEPIQSVTIQAQLPDLIKSTSNFIRDNAPSLLGGFAITVTYMREN